MTPDHARFSETVLKRIESEDHLRRLTIIRRKDGFFSYREDWFAEWDDAPAAWQDGYPPSGLFADVDEAEAEARSTIGWLKSSF